MNNYTTGACGAVPAQPIHRARRSTQLNDDTNRVREANGAVRRVCREIEHTTLRDDNVAKRALVDDFEDHSTTVLVEPLGCAVDVIVGPSIRASNNLRLISWAAKMAGEEGLP